MQCFKCAKDKEVRPYGPGGSLVCFTCMQSSQELRSEAEAQFAMQIEGIKGPVILGSELGPIPLNKEFIQ